MSGTSARFSPDAAARYIHKWLGASPESPILVLGGDGGEELTLTLDALTTRSAPDLWTRGMTWLRLYADGSTVSSADTAPDVAWRTVTGTSCPGDAVRPVVLFVDDYDALEDRDDPRATAVLKLLTRTSRLRDTGSRVVLGCQDSPLDEGRHDHVRVAFRTSRAALVDRIAAWTRDRNAEPTLVVKGRPGSGKTCLLDAAIGHLQDLPDVIVGLCRPTVPRPPTMDDFARTVLNALGPEKIRVGRAVNIFVNADGVGGDVIGVKAGAVHFDTSAYTPGYVRVVLRERASLGNDPPVLILIVDGLERFDDDVSSAAAFVRELAEDSEMLRRCDIRLIVAAHKLLDVPAEVVDLDANSDADIREYARVRLRRLHIGDETAQVAARRLMELSGGLFIVAAGYLDELADDAPADVLDRWANARPVSDAAHYFTQALQRTLDAIAKRPVAGPQDCSDAERFLRILALTPVGMTAEEMAAVWSAPGRKAPGTSAWSHASTGVRDGPAARYVHLPEAAGGGRYRLLHPAVRDAIVAGRPSSETIGLQAERQRFLDALTPLTTGGRGWDAQGGRLAMGAVGSVAHDLLHSALSEDPPNQAVADVCRNVVCRLVADWQWLEDYIGNHRVDDDVPLGIHSLLADLDRLADLDGADLDRTSAVLWADAVEPTRSASGVTRPPASRRVAPPTTKGPRYLDARAPTVAEILQGRHVTTSRDKAIARLRLVLSGRTLKRPPVGSDDPLNPVAWVKGYALTPEETRDGYIGNYARFRVEHRTDGRWSVRAEKVPLKNHPGRKRPGGNGNPNWGHPILRNAEGNPRHPNKSGKRHRDATDAFAELRQLREEFPESAILVEDTLFIIVYSRKAPSPPVMTRIRLEVARRAEGFVLVIRPNEKSGEAAR